MSAAQQIAAHAATSTKSFAAGLAARAVQFRAAQLRAAAGTEKQHFSFSDAFAAAGYVALSAYGLALIVNAALIY